MLFDNIAEKKNYLLLFIKNILDILDHDYYYDINYDKLYLDIISAITNNLDPYSNFLNKNQLKNNNSTASSVELNYLPEYDMNILSINFFDKNTAAELKCYSASLKPGNKVVVLNLCNNTGGNIRFLYDTCNILIDKETDYTFVNKLGEQERYHITNTRQYFIIAGVVVNHATSSSAEALAYLLQTINIPVIGEKTFGKGVAQNYHQIYGGQLSITSKKFVGPSGNGFNGYGITPDIHISDWDNPKNILSILAKLFSDI